MSLFALLVSPLSRILWFSNSFASSSFEMLESCNFEGCATIGGAPEDDRGYRKKSREKMRRQEVNVKVMYFSVDCVH